ncbi:MAG: aldo/keto reductase [Oscillospiraceae bacterium]|nr:aldo/keto reductase [Oscillospiraceae bacterium]
MQYRSFQGLTLSRLGMGNMRLPTTADGQVDLEKARAILEYAYQHGVNYFDTAYSYHGGQSEPVVGEILKQFPRDTWYLATKMPGHEINPNFQPKPIFAEQLRRCQVDYFDFYLLHNVYDKSVEVYSDESLGIIPFLQEQKKEGTIRHFGFSTHASLDVLRRFLDRYDGVFEFVQMQLNYLDWTLQNAEATYALLRERNLPVIVMEPCRGGKLAKLPEDAEQKLRAFRPDDSDASWAFRWLQEKEGVQIVLSGMSTMEQIRENVRTFSEEKPLTEEERACLEGITGEMLKNLIPCTACRYCCKSCPQELNIPRLISLYSDFVLGNTLTSSMLVDSLPEDKQPQACIGCGNCRQVCPQGIDVPDIMKKFAELLRGIPHWTEISKERAKLHVYE